MRDGDLEALRGEIDKLFGTAHAFCRQSGLPRSTVYTVLSGRYPGNVERQMERIRAALAGRDKLEAAVLKAIHTTACGRCKNRRACARQRHGCLTGFEAMTEAVMAAISQLG